MDRPIVYTQEQGRSTDFLFGQRAAMVGLGKLIEAVFGTGTLVAGLSVIPTAPASMSVWVNPGQIFAIEPLDATAYGVLAADTTHSIVKQGLLMDQSALSCPAPGTAGFSINYLIQATYQDSDTTNVVLPYFNSANPTQPLSGQNNSGAAQATERQGLCIVAVKAGAAAATGTQTTPAPDAGYVGLAVVTVANGAVTIIAGNIATYSGAPYISETLTQKISQATGDARYVSLSAAGGFRGVLAVNANITLTPGQAGYWVEGGAAVTPFTVTLPLANTLASGGAGYYFKNDNAAAMTVAPAGADVIQTGFGAITSLTLPQGASAWIISGGGTSWYLIGGSSQLMRSNQIWMRGQSGQVIALPATTGTVTVDLATSNNFEGTLTGNITLANPTNIVPGQSGVIRIINGAGPFTVAFGAYWKFPGGVAPSLTAVAGAVDDIGYYAESTTRIVCVMQGNTL